MAAWGDTVGPLDSTPQPMTLSAFFEEAVGVDDRAIGEMRKLELELLWQPNVVGIEQRAVGAPCRLEAGVARGRSPSVRTRDQTDARIGGRVAGDDLARSVGRAVVDRDQLPVFAGLRLDRLDRLGDGLLGVEDGNDDREGRWIGHAVISP